jgi:hypothetical protein
MGTTSRFVLSGFLVVCASVAACGGDPEAPPAASETQTSRQPNVPTTVTGCLRAGEAGDTFVLTTSRTEDGTTPSTYHLTGAADIDLQDHVGKRIEVTGVVEAQSQIATRESAQPADKATGTAGSAGTPSVQTTTGLSVQRLNVTAIKPAQGECEK